LSELCNAARLLCSLVALLTEISWSTYVKTSQVYFFASDHGPRLVADDLLANAFILRSVTGVSDFASTSVLSP